MAEESARTRSLGRADARRARERVHALREHDVRRWQRDDRRAQRATPHATPPDGEAEFDLNYALSRLTPGTNLLAFCTAAGWTARRWLGAVAALLATSLPRSIIVLVISAFYVELHDSALFQTALRGALAAGVANMASTAWVFAEPHVNAAPRNVMAIAPCVAALSLGAPLLAMKILLLAAAAGILWPVKTARTE